MEKSTLQTYGLIVFTLCIVWGSCGVLQGDGFMEGIFTNINAIGDIVAYLVGMVFVGGFIALILSLGASDDSETDN